VRSAGRSQVRRGFLALTLLAGAGVGVFTLDRQKSPIPLGVRPFASSSPWNVPISHSATYSLGRQASSELRTAGFMVNSAAYSVPVYQATGQDREAEVRSKGRVVHFQIPVGAKPAVGTDATMVVLQPDGRSEDECWDAHRIGGDLWTCGYEARVNLAGSGMGDGVRASGASALGGLLRVDDLLGGPIRHALAMALPGEALRPGWVAPAISEDAHPVHPYRGVIPMGTHLAMEPGLPIAKLGLGPVAQRVATALEEYGGYVVDESDVLTLYAQSSAPATTIGRLRVELRRLVPYLRIVHRSA
jgi:hypothetical protein